MINGQFGAWLDEARQHWQSAMAAGAFIKTVLPLQEWIRIAVVTGATAIVTSQITMARFDERLIASNEKMLQLFAAMKSERELIVKKRDEQVMEVRKEADRQVVTLRNDVDRIEIIVHDLRVEIARIKK
jgi:hypothetical protein